MFGNGNDRVGTTTTAVRAHRAVRAVATVVAAVASAARQAVVAALVVVDSAADLVAGPVVREAKVARAEVPAHGDSIPAISLIPCPSCVSTSTPARPTRWRS